ncbi:MAG: glycosyltransferase family 2 protein [Acidobacteria bacterium]|nr:glycosyltransferase family 2 protein [Acidobacteriota bacterium]
MELTGIVIAKNEVNHVAGVVKSLLSVCDNVIVVDSGSTDETQTLAEKAGAKVVFHEWEGFKGQRRFADTLSKTDWVLVLDADERLSKGLIQAISQLKRQMKPSNIHAYSFQRNLHFMNRCFRNNILTSERKTRLYNRSFAKWNGGTVHEAVSVTGKTVNIAEMIEHYPFENLEEAKEKLRTYAFMKAMDKHNAGKRIGFFGILLHIIITFLKKYIWQCYFLKGTPGLILSWLETDYTAIKYMKLYELNHSFDEKENKDEQ